MYIIFLVISLIASILGAISGIGGGIIIKPILDSFNLMDASKISFLSGCTVLSMSSVSIFRSIHNKEGAIEIKSGTTLAISAAVGGILGKSIFNYIFLTLPNRNDVLIIQNSILLIVTIATFIYTIMNNIGRIRLLHITSTIITILIGASLGIMSSFLGIGGGPINLVLLSYFFSYDTKKSAQNSLYIIFFSQLASLVISFFTGVPKVNRISLIFMVIGGISGGLMGSKIKGYLSNQTTIKLFMGMMIFIIGICIWNVLGYMNML